jgi:hypothetical protein
MLPAMVTVEAKQTDFNGDQPEGKKKLVDMARWQDSPLARTMDDSERRWFLNHVCSRFEAMHQGMSTWRMKMRVWERQSEGDFTDRIMAPDQVNPSTVKDIFIDQNDTLGLVNGFCDFHYAQAKDDLFGTKPWLAVTPEGKADIDLADTISKHAQWKFNHSDMEATLLDALRVSTWGGTAFVKECWENDVETFERIVNAAHDAMTGEQIRNEAGDFITTAEEIEALIEQGARIDPGAVFWREVEIQDTLAVYQNVTASMVDYHDIAFDPLAPALDLRHTDVFVKFRMGMLDAMRKFNIPDEERGRLFGAITGITENARQHRDEIANDLHDSYEEQTNPVITLVEGFVRVKPKLTGALSRIHVIFSPDLHILFAVDYLANVTPGAMLPVLPIRINKTPGRIFGVGYFEKFQDFNNAVDRQYNTTTYRNRFSQHVYTAVNPSALKDAGEGFDVQALDPKTPYELAVDKTIEDFLQFKTMPDNNTRSIELMNQMLQMAQMISGITSAAQGELKGVPNATTATGVRDLQSRGATILKSPIDEQSSDIRVIVEYGVHVLYANHDRDETFTWNEGRNAELLTMKANDVAGLRANVTLTMSQSQNARKIESAQAAIGMLQAYIGLPEIDKTTAKPLFEQALSALGFHNAADILRDGVVDAASLLEITPPDLQPAVQMAIEQSAMMPPAGSAPEEMLDPSMPFPGEEEELPPEAAVAPVDEFSAV